MESYTVNTGEQEPIYRRIDEFFQGIIKKIKEDKNRPSQIEIKIENHCRGVSTLLDNKTHMLLYQERVMAVVTETRNENNYIQFDFFKLPNKDYKSLSQRKNLQ